MGPNGPNGPPWGAQWAHGGPNGPMGGPMGPIGAPWGAQWAHGGPNNNIINVIMLILIITFKTSDFRGMVRQTTLKQVIPVQEPRQTGLPLV